MIGTFLGNYIWQRISGLREIAEVWGLDKNFAGSGIKGNSKVKGDGHEYPSPHGLWQGVFEIVGMLSVGDVDGHLSSEPDELAGAGIGDDGDA